MRNKILFLSCMVYFSMMSCEDERDMIKEVSDVPDTIELSKANFHGQIVDNDQRPIQNATVKIMYETYLLGETTTNAEGKFNLVSQAAHAEKTYIVFEKEGYSPNVFSKKIIENEDIEILPSLKALNIKQSIGNEITSIQINDDIKVTLPSGLVASMDAKAKMQYFDLTKESKNYLLADLTIDDRIAPEKVFWLDIVGPDDKSITWISGKEVIVTFSEKIKKELSKEFWFFDIQAARWIKQATLSNAGQINIKKPGFYAFINPCLSDVEKPVPYIHNSTTFLYQNGPTNIIYASDLDKGSYDNCDINLTFAMRRLTDDCMNGSNIYSPSLILCESDAGKKIEVAIKVTDDNNNSDSVIVHLFVVSNANPCLTDTKKPIPYCITNVDLSFSGTGGKVPASYFDVGSFDDCTSKPNLIFLTKKVQPDICPNWTNDLSPSFVFCSEEIGKTLEIEMNVFDQAGNRDYCLLSVKIKP